MRQPQAGLEHGCSSKATPCRQQGDCFDDSTRPTYNEGDEEQDCQDPFLFGLL